MDSCVYWLDVADTQPCLGLFICGGLGFEVYGWMVVLTVWMLLTRSLLSAC